MAYQCIASAWGVLRAPGTHLGFGLIQHLALLLVADVVNSFLTWVPTEGESATGASTERGDAAPRIQSLTSSPPTGFLGYV